MVRVVPYLRVVHEPHQAARLRVQDEVASQELAAALRLLDVKEAADAVLPIHVRHDGAGTFPGPAGPGQELKGGGAGAGEHRRLGLEKQSPGGSGGETPAKRGEGGGGGVEGKS